MIFANYFNVYAFFFLNRPEIGNHVPTLRLIDFGCAIDMDFFHPKKQFKKVFTIYQYSAVIVISYILLLL